ncbi:MAG: HTTM domain-containing protein [Verrucomicrobiota bacterium]
MITRSWQGWINLLSRTEGAEPLAACRIMAGIGVMSSLAIIIPSGVINILWTREGLVWYASEHAWLVNLLGEPSPAKVWTLVGITMVAGCGLLVGFFTRVCALLSLILFLNLIHINPSDGSAYDSVLTNQLFLLVFAGSGATWSVDCRRRTGKWSSLDPVPAWPRYIMIFQLVLIYFSTGLQKVSADWIPGGDLSAVYYILQDPFWRRFDVTELTARWYPLTQFGTLVTWLWEVTAPLLLLAFYFRATRNRKSLLRGLFNKVDFRLWWAVIGITFHVCIHLLMRVGPFSWITLSYYPALWSAREWRRRKRQKDAK